MSVIRQAACKSQECRLPLLVTRPGVRKIDENC